MRTMDIIQRPRALNWFKTWRDRDVIKVVTGLRRSGKSTAMKLARQALEADGTPPNAIIYLDIERMAFDAPKTAEELYRMVISRMDVSEQKQT